MNIQTYFEEKKELQKRILDFLDNRCNVEENYQNLQIIICDQKIRENMHELKILLYLINKISINHHRYPDFISKIEQLLLLFKNEIRIYFKNFDIFKIFKRNKRILLFFIQNQTLTIDQRIFDEMIKWQYKSNQYLQYFTPEIKEKLQNKQIKCSKEVAYELLEIIPDNFYEKRKKGENDEIVSEMIRDDKIEDFITYVNKKDLSLISEIPFSIYETNSLLLKRKRLNLIEYAAFCGSIQIFKYLYLNKVEMTSSLWIYAIHGDNPEIIHILEDKKIKPEKIIDNENENYYDDEFGYDRTEEEEENEDFSKVFIESIKCHHNDIAHYIIENYFINEKEKDFIIMKKSIKHYNFNLIENSFIEQNMFFYYLCKYDYYYPIYLILNNSNIDVNKIYAREKKSKNNKDSIEEKTTALFVSVKNEKIEIIKLLLSNEDINVNSEITYIKKHNGICHNQIDKDLTTSLTEAVQKENIEIVELLLSNKNINVNIPCNCYFKSEREKSIDDQTVNKNDNLIQYKETALHIAVKKKNLEIIKLLLKNKNIDVNIRYEYIDYYYILDPNDLKYDGYLESREEKDEITALSIAIENKDIEIIELLLSNNNLDVNLPSFKYIESKDEIDINQRNIHHCENSILIENKKIVEKKSPLCISIENKTFDITEILLKHKEIDVNYKKYYKENLYKKYQNDCNQSEFIDNKPLLYLAIEEKDLKAVQLLLSNENINTNLQFDYYYYNNNKNDIKTITVIENETPLHLAIKLGNCNFVELLLKDKNIDVNLGGKYVKSKNGKEVKNEYETPLRCAVNDHENIEIINLLLKNNGID